MLHRADKGLFRHTSVWRGNLLTERAASVFSPALEAVHTISLHTDEVSIVSKNVSEIRFREIIEKAQLEPHSQAELQFITASSFKRSGRYGNAGLALCAALQR